jgi:ubiquinone/menaquinone biosynthesis C-methylase UbiE
LKIKSGKNYSDAKQQVHNFWDEVACGENLLKERADTADYEAHAKIRYELEGEIIFPLARFEEAKGLKVLEVGVGLGGEHQLFAQSGADLYGIDLTERAVKHTRQRLELLNLFSNLSVGDAENIDFPDESFDLVYSWGVLHHSPNTPQAISEVFRVLKRGGEARIMIYHKWSMVGFMLWMRYALLRLQPWISLREIYARYLESPGTKAYSVTEATELFSSFKNVKIKTHMSHGDLLESNVGQRHRGLALTLAKKFWPRWFIRRFLPKAGLFMAIEATK